MWEIVVNLRIILPKILSKTKQNSFVNLCVFCSASSLPDLSKDWRTLHKVVVFVRLFRPPPSHTPLLPGWILYTRVWFTPRSPSFFSGSWNAQTRSTLRLFWSCNNFDWFFSLYKQEFRSHLTHSFSVSSSSHISFTTSSLPLQSFILFFYFIIFLGFEFLL